MPHIIEKVFLSLDLESFKTCYEVSKAWKEFITSDSFKRKVKIHFRSDIEDDESRLCRMSGKGHSSEVKKLLSYELLDVNCVSWMKKRTPLHEASDNGHSDTVKMLLDAGADLSLTEEYGQTPLHLAAMNGHARGRVEVAKILTEAGADPNMRDTDPCRGETPLHWASYRGVNDMVKIFLGTMHI